MGRPRSRWWTWAAVPAVWLLAALASSTRGGMMITDGVARPMPWSQIFVGNLYDYGWWMALGPLVVLGVRRIGAPSSRSVRGRIALHLLLAAGVVIAYWILLSRIALPGATLRLAPSLAGLESVLPSALAIHTVIATGALAWTAHERARSREREASALHAALMEAHLGALRAQLHPHFLFNALHAVSTLIDVDPAAARRTLVQLSEILRMAIEFSEQSTVPLTREVEWVEHYLELQATRFGNRLTFDLRVAPEAMQATVPPLIVQPLVENAIKHGIEPRAEGGNVAVEASVAHGRLRIRVLDDGPGVAAPTERNLGVGLRNVRARLAALYGPEGSLQVGPRSGGQGTEATLELPLDLRSTRESVS